MRLGSRFRSVVLGLSLCLYGATAEAQAVDDATRAAARTLGYAGVEAYQAGDYATASDKLEKAYSVLQAPSLGLWSARALVKLGKLVEAAERYREVQRLEPKGGDAKVQKQAQIDAAAELEALSPKIPTLVVTVEGADAKEIEISIDGTKLAAALVGEARPLNPGRHVVEGVRGDERVTEEITLAEAEAQRIVLRFAPKAGVQAAPAPTFDAGSSVTPVKTGGSKMRTLGFVALGVGGAGLVLGGVTGVMALGKKGDLEDNPWCDDELRCLGIARDDVDSYNSMRTISSIGFIAGGVLAATGVVLVLTAPKNREPATALWVGPGSAGLRGAF